MRPRGTTRAELVAAYERANLECARIIAADPRKYPRDGLPGIWARMVLDRERTSISLRREWRLVA